MNINNLIEKVVNGSSVIDVVNSVVEASKFEIVNIMNDALKFSKGLDSNVKVLKRENTIFFDGDKKKILAVKKKVGDYIVKKYSNRKLLHAKSKGFKIWWVFVGDKADVQRTGLELKLTDDEEKAFTQGRLR
jgi:hypothetical protein